MIIARSDLMMLSMVIGKVDPILFTWNSAVNRNVEAALSIPLSESDVSGTSVKHENAKSTNFVLTLHVNF